MDFIEVTAERNKERIKTLISIDNIISISEYGGKSKQALICIQQQNGEKMTLKCIESYRIVRKRLLEQINEAAGKE